MTTVGGTRVAAASGGVLADLVAGRTAASTDDGEFGALFARTLDLADARPPLGSDRVSERAEPAQRRAEQVRRDDDSGSSPARSAAADRQVERESRVDRAADLDGSEMAGTDDDGADEAGASAPAAMVVPPVVVVGASTVPQIGVSLLASADSNTAASNTPASNTAGAVAGDVGVTPTETAAAPGAVATTGGASEAGSVGVPAAMPSPDTSAASESVLPDAVSVTVPSIPAEQVGEPVVDAAESGAVSLSPEQPTAAAATDAPAPSTPASQEASGASAIDPTLMDPGTPEGVGVGSETSTVDLDVAATEVDAPNRESVRPVASANRAESASPAVAVLGGEGPGRSSASPGAAGLDLSAADPTQRLDDLRRLRERAALGGLGDSTMSVDLSDEGLGQLTLHALHRNGGLHLTLSAAEQATRDLLLRQGDQLRSDFEAGGVALGSLDIQHSGGRTAGGRDGNGRGELVVRRDTGVARTSLPGVAAAIAPLRSRPSDDGLDLMI